MDLDQSATLESQLGILEIISRAIRIDTIVGIIACVSSFALAAHLKAESAVWALIGAPATLSMMLWIAGQKLLNKPPHITKVRDWERFYILLNFLVGLSWGLLIAGAAWMNTAPLFIYSVIALVGILTLIKLATFAGLHLATGAFIVAAYGCGVSVAAKDLSKIDIVLIIICAFAVAATFTAARMIGLVTATGITIKSHRDQLQAMLDQRKTQVEKLNVALKTNEDKRQEAEGSLRKAAANLGLAEGKAKALATTLERVSPLCQVTGLANRRHFDQNLDTEWRRAMREGHSMSIILIGIDEFETYVDAYGPQSSDTLLKRVGQSIKGFGRRAGDMAGRYDDTTLALLLPRCDVRNALRMAEALRRRVEATKIANLGARNRSIVTAHVAVATTKPGRGLPSSELLNRADTALYEAKFQGGNKVVSYRPLSQLKLEKWDINNDGSLNEQSLMQKLLVWGYDTTQATFRESDPAREHASDKDTVLAVLNGEVLLEIEGHTMALTGGDSVFIPKSIEISLKVTSKQPSTIFTAFKSE